MAAPLANPERDWPSPGRTTNASVAEVEACLGERVDAPLVFLGGGRANTNVLVGDRVVRIFRRDPAAAAKEAALLARPWTTFRVPKVRNAGEGFLVLEHVAHGPVLDDAAHGAAIGRALAEIHAVHREPTADLIGSFLDHVRGKLDDRPVSALEAIAPTLRDVIGPPVLVHADFKASNLHWAEDGRLLVLDWEFAYAGAALSDIGQLLRWEPSPDFVAAFAGAYGPLVDGWQRYAAALDLVNLAGLPKNADVVRRIEKTLALL